METRSSVLRRNAILRKSGKLAKKPTESARKPLGTNNSQASIPTKNGAIKKRASIKVKKVPDWSKIHKKEEALKEKRMSVYKRPTTQASEPKFQSENRIKKRELKTKIPKPASVANTDRPAGINSVDGSTTQDECSANFNSDASALQSILTNVGITHTQQGLGTTAPQKQTSTAASEYLEKKRASMYTRPISTMYTPGRLRDRMSQYFMRNQQQDEEKSSVKLLQFNSNEGQGPTTPNNPSTSRRMTVATAPVANQVAQEFEVNPDALQGIVSGTGIEVDNKAMRASVYYGPLRVSKNAKSSRRNTNYHNNEPITPAKVHHHVPMTPRSAIKRLTLDPTTPRSQYKLPMESPFSIKSKPRQFGLLIGNASKNEMETLKEVESDPRKLSEISNQNALEQLEKMRLEELELEKELERELLAEAQEIAIKQTETLITESEPVKKTVTNPTSTGFRSLNSGSSKINFGLSKLRGPSATNEKPPQNAPTSDSQTSMAISTNFEIEDKDDSELLNVWNNKQDEFNKREFYNPLFKTIATDEPMPYQFIPIPMREKMDTSKKTRQGSAFVRLV
eukprot:m.126713 g.126713  ORF g.126713 m.126713 type:complete len:566 (-) comp14522_c0_seq2:1126-2823(-)